MILAGLVAASLLATLYWGSSFYALPDICLGAMIGVLLSWLRWRARWGFRR